MGFFDKIKNMFTEEVEDDVKVEQIKKEVTHVAIESPNAKQDDEFEEQIIENYEFKEEINKPVFFDDNDFRDLNLTKKEEHVEEKEEIKPEREIYGSKLATEEVREKKVFKPTPIISPVYGVLDKNYHKEDIVSRQDVKSKSVEVDAIDSVRNKAYGTLEDELENTLFGNNSILFKSDEEISNDIKFTEVDDDILTNLTDDISKELDELLIKKEKYVEDDEELNNNINEDDLLDFIDSTLYKEGEE